MCSRRGTQLQFYSTFCIAWLCNGNPAEHF